MHVAELALLLRLPESPRWLVRGGDRDGAAAVLRRVRPSGFDVDGELDEMADLARKEQKASTRGWSGLRERWVRPALVLGCGIAIFTQLSGIEMIVYYSPTILTDAGFAADVALNVSVALGLSYLLAQLGGLAIIDRVGRRRLTLIMIPGAAVALFVLGRAGSSPPTSPVPRPLRHRAEIHWPGATTIHRVTASPIAIDTASIEGGVIIAVAGEIDLLTADELTEALETEVARQALVVVDLTAVSFLSSSGLAALALAHRAAVEAGHVLRLVAGNRVTLRPIQITGLADEIGVFASLPDAVAGVASVDSPDRARLRCPPGTARRRRHRRRAHRRPRPDGLGHHDGQPPGPPGHPGRRRAVGGRPPDAAGLGAGRRPPPHDRRGPRAGRLRGHGQLRRARLPEPAGHDRPARDL